MLQPVLLPSAAAFCPLRIIINDGYKTCYDNNTNHHNTTNNHKTHGNNDNVNHDNVNHDNDDNNNHIRTIPERLNTPRALLDAPNILAARAPYSMVPHT